MSILKKLFSHNSGDKLPRTEGLYVQGSSPKLFVKNVSDVFDTKPVCDQVAQVQFLDRTGRLGALISSFHSRNGARGLKLSLRSRTGASDGARMMILDVGRRQMVMASRPPVVSRDSEVATADYVREMLSRSRRFSMMAVRDGTADVVTLNELIPMDLYRLGVTFLVQANDCKNFDVMSFQVGKRYVMDCNVDVPGVYYVEQMIKSDKNGCISVSLRHSIADFNGQIKVEASLA